MPRFFSPLSPSLSDGELRLNNTFSQYLCEYDSVILKKKLICHTLHVHVHNMIHVHVHNIIHVSCPTHETQPVQPNFLETL